MKISLITATYNSGNTLRDTIQSVLSQTYVDIEYIIKDGGSSDNTLDIIKEYVPKFEGRLHWVSNKDFGIYDAMNKGLEMVTGDIVGIINSDDFFSSNHVIEQIAEEFKDKVIAAVYGDIHFVDPDNLKKSVRHYSSRIFHTSLMRFGFMPAHPSFYVRRECYKKYGLYNTTYKIAADFDLLIRFLYKHKISAKYINMDFVTMRTGGASTNGLKSKILLCREQVKACRKNGIYTNIVIVLLKYVYKIFELR
jgi:glycosyltransferase involved in cell wall biosynthesis